MSEPNLTRRRMMATAAGLGLTGLAGCSSIIGSGSGENDEEEPGHDDEEHAHGGVGEPTDTAEVKVNTARGEETTEYHFDPHVVRVTEGGTVTWTLESGNHTATAYHPEYDQPQLVPEGTPAWDSGTLSEEGETYEHTFETEGVYHYYCKPHEQFGMLATVIVGEPHLDDEPAMTLPEDKSDEVRGKLENLNDMVRDAVGDGGSSHDDGTETTDDGHDDHEH
jgi:plastocyanin